jgi:hypothetical protein
MKKLLLIIVLFLTSLIGFTQGINDPIKPTNQSNLNLDIKSTPPQQQYSQSYYDLNEQARKLRKQGGLDLAWGFLLGGSGALLLAYQPSPYVNYPTTWRFYTGVTCVVLGGLEFILAGVNFGRAAVLVNKSKNITLTPSKQNIGIALNF